MKRFLLVSFALFISSLMHGQDTLVVIWEEQFADSIPDTWEVGPGTPEGAIWQWSATGRADEALLDGIVTDALFYGNLGAIESPSVDNGCAMYNSDVYDGGGVGVGQGPFPGTHSGTLTSPSIDLTDWDDVSLKFNQFARANANAVSTLLEVSIDGGENWTDIPINPDVNINRLTRPDDLQIIEISDLVANQSDVKIRFTWNGRYYYWLIDDVQLIQTPKYSLKLEDFVFFPPAALFQPESQIAGDTMGFSASISNMAREDRYNVVLKAEVLDASDQVLFADSTVLDTFPAVYQDSFVTIENLYPPEGLGTGTYTVSYELYSLDGMEDFNPRNNTFQEQFGVTPDTYAMEDGDLVGFSGGMEYQVGNTYRISPLIGDGFIATEASFGAGKSAADGPFDGEGGTIFMYKVSEEVDAGWDNFQDASDQDEFLELVGFQSYTFPNGYQNYNITSAELLNIDGDPGIALEPGFRYLLVMSYEGNDVTIFHGFDLGVKFWQVATLVYTDMWFTGGFGEDFSAAMRMTIELVDATDTQPLKESAMNLFPNPSSDRLTVDLDLDTPGEAVIVIASADGKIMMMQEYDNVQSENLTFDVSSYPAGSYFVRVGTQEGTKTKQFVKID